MCTLGGDWGVYLAGNDAMEPLVEAAGGLSGTLLLLDLLEPPHRRRTLHALARHRVEALVAGGDGGLHRRGGLLNPEVGWAATVLLLQRQDNVAVPRDALGDEGEERRHVLVLRPLRVSKARER